MICILHGYLLDGSGSNLWTRSVVRALCRGGEDVHLVCQEPHPEHYDFISDAIAYNPDGTVETLLKREPAYPGRCIMHKPVLGETLPVYVWDQYEEFERVIPMTELSDTELENYLHLNVQAMTRIVHEHGITVMHANHAVLMSVVAQRVSAWTGVPYVVMPHGSALEYAVKPDDRLWRLALGALEDASRLFVISHEIAERTARIFPSAADALSTRLSLLDLGVDTAAFQPLPPSERRGNIERVKELLEELPRGRTAEQSRALLEPVDGGPGPQTDAEAESAAHAAVAAVGEYVAKQPDEDVERKLDSVDWETAQVLAYVGRLIPAKGIHALIGALPFILAGAPRLRLIIVGHGPLREPLELLLHAMSQGDRRLARAAITHAETIGAGEPEHLEALRIFWGDLARNGREDSYWHAASRLVKPDTVLFTGYLTHREMAWLLPCCDAAIFPSMVIESGPLVFLEALASGVFPIGTYFGGMQVKIDVASPYLEAEDRTAMKVRPDAAHIVADIAHAVPLALPLGVKYRSTLRRVAEDHYDWKPVGRRLRDLLLDCTRLVETNPTGSGEAAIDAAETAAAGTAAAATAAAAADAKANPPPA